MNISVIMATYNGEKYIREQLNSIIPFMDDNDELIISDDGSTDGTLGIINLYRQNDQRIILVDGPRNGVIKNFENALQLARKDIIMFADQDDIWLPEKLPFVREFFRTSRDKVILHDMYMADDKEIAIGERGTRSFAVRHRRHGVLYNWLYSGYYGCCIAITKEFKKNILPFSKYTNMYDQLIGLIAEYQKCVSFIDKPLIIHRIHGQNMSQNQTIMARLQMRVKSYMAFIDTIRSRK